MADPIWRSRLIKIIWIYLAVILDPPFRIFYIRMKIKLPSETPGAILFAQKKSKFAELSYYYNHIYSLQTYRVFTHDWLNFTNSACLVLPFIWRSSLLNILESECAWRIEISLNVNLFGYVYKCRVFGLFLFTCVWTICLHNCLGFCCYIIVYSFNIFYTGFCCYTKQCVVLFL